ncbi:amidohydrolase 3 [Hyaloraphidium curvatum]|nr:amidohydrolase 3 [Hyaloraphidium curvatum]
MAADTIFKASSVITMAADTPRAEAVAVDSATGRIVAAGALSSLERAHPSAKLVDLGSSVLMPGFIDPHSHPLMSGMLTQEPTQWIAPYVGHGASSWPQLQDKFRELDATLDPGKPVLFNGYDRMLHGAPELDNKMLDAFFPSRPVAILDNSGHELYFNSAIIELNGWECGKPPPDPVGAHFGRNPDGKSNGRAYEMGSILMAVGKVLQLAVPHPLASAAKFFSYMSRNGITATSEHAFQEESKKGYVALASSPDVPLRVALYHVSIEPSCGDEFTSPISKELLWKQGIKLWADGSPWVGNIANTFPYLDNEKVCAAGIPIHMGAKALNYPREAMDLLVDKHVASGVQFAMHCNGDLAFDVVLDCYEAALRKHNLLGTDHRWRVEHVGAARKDQFKRAADLGVGISMSPFHFIYWGDVLDGTLFAPEIGSQWQRGRDAFDSGASISFHNDGMVSPPIPLLNVQCMVTRTTIAGNVHGENQKVTIEEAFKAHTVNAAYQIGRDKDLGSIEAGKLADFVVLSADPFKVDPLKVTEEVKVQGTYVGGRKVDHEAFENYVHSIDPSEHKELKNSLPRKCC